MHSRSATNSPYTLPNAASILDHLLFSCAGSLSRYRLLFGWCKCVFIRQAPGRTLGRLVAHSGLAAPGTEHAGFIEARTRTRHCKQVTPALPPNRMYGPPPFCKRKVRSQNWPARMYPALIGVAISWPTIAWLHRRGTPTNWRWGILESRHCSCRHSRNQAGRAPCWRSCQC